MKTFEQFNNNFDELPNNRLFIYLQQKLEHSNYHIIYDGSEEGFEYVDILDGKKPIIKDGISNTLFDITPPFTIEKLHNIIDPYLKEMPKNPHKNYENYIKFSKFLKPILDEWDRKSDKEKSKFILSEEELKKLTEKPIEEPPGKVICIKDYNMWVGEETLAYNNISDPKYVCYKKGETYEYSGYHGDDMITTYVDSKLKNPNAEHNSDYPKMIYQMFVVKRSDEELKKLIKHRILVKKLLRQHPEMKESDFPDTNSGQLFFKHFKVIK